MRRQQDQIEPVVDLVNAIFHRDTRHRMSLSLKGTELLIMCASYRPCGLFARPICDLRSPSALITRPRGQKAGASRHTANAVLDKKSLHCTVKSIGLFALAAPHLRWRFVRGQIHRSLGSKSPGGARLVAAAPKTLTTT